MIHKIVLSYLPHTIITIKINNSNILIGGLIFAQGWDISHRKGYIIKALKWPKTCPGHIL